MEYVIVYKNKMTLYWSGKTWTMNVQLAKPMTLEDAHKEMTSLQTNNTLDNMFLMEVEYE